MRHGWKGDSYRQACELSLTLVVSNIMLHNPYIYAIGLILVITYMQWRYSYLMMIKDVHQSLYVGFHNHPFPKHQAESIS